MCPIRLDILVVGGRIQIVRRMSKMAFSFHPPTPDFGKLSRTARLDAPLRKQDRIE